MKPSEAIQAPLLDVCGDLFAETEDGGRGGDDMAAVIHAIAARSGLEIKPTRPARRE